MWDCWVEGGGGGKVGEVGNGAFWGGVHLPSRHAS